MPRILEVSVEKWPIVGGFTIARGKKTEAIVVVATIREDSRSGCGEAVPYPRYGESVASVREAMEAMADQVADGIDRRDLQRAMPAGAARCAIDCALWDLEAKRSGIPVAEAIGAAPLRRLETALTLSLDSPQSMRAAAGAAVDGGYTTLKIKLGGAGDPERIASVRRGAPDARLIVDANEGWSAATFDVNLGACVDAGVALIEQPLPAGDDTLLDQMLHPIPICADEAVHVTRDLETVARRYDAVNVKVDKAGGLTEALVLSAAARKLGLKTMVGCMVATSLSMAPAFLVAQTADFVDLDGPLLLGRDRANGFRYERGKMLPPDAALWG